MRRFETTIITCLMLAIVSWPASAGVLEEIRAVFAPSAKPSGGIDAAAAHIKTLPVQPDRPAIATSATQEGHWRLVNRAGETMTAANAEELTRALNVLAPEMAGNAKARLVLYVDEETVFLRRPLVWQLPSADLYVVIGADAYRVRNAPPSTNPRFLAAFVDVPPRLIVKLDDRGVFDETLAQLARPLGKTQIRSIALEPGGPAMLPSSPRIDPDTKRALTDPIDPDRLRHSLSGLRGQTALVTGRVDGDLLFFRPSSGPERSLLLRDLTAAAEAADVDLIVLKSSSARQPGARTWLWQRTEVANLDAAIERGRLAEFLSALGGDGDRLSVATKVENTSRTRLEIDPIREGFFDDPAIKPLSGPITGVVKDILSEVTAKVPVQGISAYMRSSQRDRELSRRVVPGIPSWLQMSYAAGLALGLLGFAVARGWWRRIWPPERAAEYGNLFGFQAARLARHLAFGLLFLPLAGPLALLALPFRRKSARAART